jgi:hypothetical protein
MLLSSNWSLGPAVILKTPSLLVLVPTRDDFTLIETPTSGAPVLESTTLPLITL